MRHRCAGSQVKPDSRNATRSLGKASNTASTIMLVSWVANTPAMSAYTSMK